jgi:endonuclease-3
LQTKDEVSDTAVDKLRTALGGTLNIEALLAVEAHVIADAISNVGSWRRKTHMVPRKT